MSATRRRPTLRAQLVLGSVGVVLITFTALALLLAAFFGHYFAAGRVHGLTVRAHRVATLLEMPPQRAAPRIRLLVAASGGHIWQVGAGGRVAAQFGPPRFGSYARWLTPAELADVVAGRVLARVAFTHSGPRQEFAVVAVPAAAHGGSASGRGAVVWVAPVGGAAILKAVGARVLLVAALGLLLAAALFTWLAGSLAGPIGHLQAAAGQIAAGRFHVPIREAGPEEVRSLGRSLRGMAERLSDLDRSRRDFLADVSHELRSPLAALRVALEGIRGGTASRSDRERYLAVAAGETARLGRLVDDLLALSRAEAGHLELHRQPVDLREAAMRVALSLEPVAQARQVVFRFDVPDATPGGAAFAVDADPDRLSQVLWNLLDNAARHTAPGAEVGIRMASDGTDLLLTVSNPGALIDPGTARRLFERFARGAGGEGAAGPQGADGGTGLGLAIARTLIEAHGGTIEAQARPEGGLSIAVRWPAAGSAA